ncbi:poly-gamma-glutamate biosynthesis protein [Actinocatenispora thailandica]|uniref:Poly-gamma-glutamate biosynthesis protein n=1 Tax=Actinocatenispora thailandica TaxID=227318 RepID=A0A7R7DQI6_9ACTN|nr:CapA family protein [Actinocatenispora thailandica]BCJ35907.1 poly-gamma-glutamate biosynthesis protein [Actinocatenispora thailandica]
MSRRAETAPLRRAAPRGATRARRTWQRSCTIVAAAAATLVAAAGCAADGPRTVSPAASAPARSAAQPSASGPRQVTVLGAGDVLVHPPVWQQARSDGHGRMDFRDILAGVRPDVSAADLAICHLETPLAGPGDAPRGWPRFAAPPQVVTAIRDTGFDDCSTASNHSYDQGTAGVADTLAALDAAHLHHAGTARSAREAGRTDLIDVHGVRIADLSYTFGLNTGLSLPAGQSWLVDITDVHRILTAAHAARRAGADIVLLSLHWGVEYQQQPTEEQRAQARTLLASPDVDAILGCHAHVVQPFQRIGGKWVVYGMGNEIARHEDPIAASREGVMPRLTFTESPGGRWRVTHLDAVPTWVDIAPKIRLVTLSAALAGHPSAARRAVYQREYRRIGAAVNSLGARVPLA